MIRASKDKFEEFLNDLKNAFPDNFENQIQNEGLSHGATSYAFIAFMHGGSAENCARDLVAKLGVEEEVNNSNNEVTNWEDEGGSI